LPFGHEQYVGMPEAELNPWLVAILSTGRLVSGRASHCGHGPSGCSISSSETL
jgi:hypothetical protein